MLKLIDAEDNIVLVRAEDVRYVKLFDKPEKDGELLYWGYVRTVEGFDHLNEDGAKLVREFYGEEIGD